MNRKISALVFLGVSALTSGAGPATNDIWSETVRGLRARLVFDGGRIVSGTQLPEVYLELHNASDVLNPIEFEFDGRRSIRFELRTADGKRAAKPTQMEMDGFIGGPIHLTLPMGGTLRFPVTWRGYGIRSYYGTMFCFESAFWEIAYDDKADYFLSATLEIPSKPREPGKLEAWHGMIKIPAVEAPTKR